MVGHTQSDIPCASGYHGDCKQTELGESEYLPRFVDHDVFSLNYMHYQLSSDSYFTSYYLVHIMVQYGTEGY